MTYKEYEGLINEGLKNPDRAPSVFASVLESIKADQATISAQTEKLSEQETRIRDLQDTNMKLFLAQTSPRANENEPEKSGEEYVDDFFNNLGK